MKSKREKLSSPKKRRIEALLAGEKPDCPPFTFWHHFRLEKQPGKIHADATLDFYRRFDLDLLKVMSDFPYPSSVPGRTIESNEDWAALKVLDNPYPEQIKALQIINREIGDEAYFVETIFQPWRVAEKISSKEIVRNLLKENPTLLRQALLHIAGSLSNHAKLALKTGAAGIFLANTAADEVVMSAKEYREIVKDSDLLVLKATTKRAKLNVLHIHGSHPHWNDLLNFPVKIVNYSMRETGIEMAKVATDFKGVLMGGIDEVGVAKANLAALQKEVNATCERVPSHRLILAPGCSVPDDIPDSALKLVRDTIRKVVW
jgi:uroporphyrinogen decarboxylase